MGTPDISQVFMNMMNVHEQEVTLSMLRDESFPVLEILLFKLFLKCSWTWWTFMNRKLHWACSEMNHFLYWKFYCSNSVSIFNFFSILEGSIQIMYISKVIIVLRWRSGKGRTLFCCKRSFEDLVFLRLCNNACGAQLCDCI